MRFQVSLAASALLSVLALTGCSVMSTTVSPSAITGAALQGEAHGGSQAIVGARVYLMAANTTSNSGYTNTNPSVSLLTTGDGTNGTTDPILPSTAKYVLTGPQGGFSITGDYACSSTSQVVYLVVMGGNPGVAGSSNANIGLMSILGQCPNTSTSSFLGTVPFLYVNEVTTVAAAYAMAGYATDAGHVFTSGSALATTGIQNAFATFSNLVNVATGTAYTTTPGANSNGAVPQANINTLANILASCVNSRGTTGSNTSAQNCTTLFGNAGSGGGSTGTTPTETATAAINIAHFPYVSSTVMSNLYGLQAGVGSPFSGLSSQPKDFSLMLTFNRSSTYARTLGVDASGNIWVSDGNTPSTLYEYSPLGVPSGNNPISHSGVTGAYRPTFDAAGNVWVANACCQGDGFSKFNSSGVFQNTYTDNTHLTIAVALAFDSSGNIWVLSNNGGTSALVEYDSGVNYVTSYTNTNGLSNASNLAIGGSDIWVINSGGGEGLSEFTASAAVNNYSTGLTGPSTISLDSSGDVWAGGRGLASKLNSGGTAALNSPFTPASSDSQSTIVAIDGSGKAWVAEGDLNFMNFTYNENIAELSSTGVALSSSTGFGASTNNLPQDLAIDGSGNLWFADGSHIYELVGIATPVITPFSAGTSTPNARP